REERIPRKQRRSGLERRSNVALIKVDLVGSSKLAEQFRGKEDVWADIINGFIEIASSEVRANGGDVYPASGDAIIAVFGRPKHGVTEGMHKENAIRAWKSILDSLEQYNARIRADRTKWNLLREELRVSTGLVVDRVDLKKIEHLDELGAEVEELSKMVESEQKLAGPQQIVVDANFSKELGKDQAKDFEFQEIHAEKSPGGKHFLLVHTKIVSEKRETARPVGERDKTRRLVLSEQKTKHGVALFSTLKNFDELAKNLDPEKREALLREYSDTIREMVGDYNGSFIRTKDNVYTALVAFGADRTTERDLALSARFALALKQKVLALGKKYGIQELLPSIGINSGRITFEKKPDGSFGILSDKVNVAARFMTSAEPGQILFSDTVFHQLKRQASFATKILGRRKFKNISSEILMHELERETPKKHLDLLFGEQAGLFVKKPEEWNFAEGIVEQVSNSRDKVLSPVEKMHAIFGPPGIGKSRLLFEITSELKKKGIDSIVVPVPISGKDKSSRMRQTLLKELLEISQASEGEELKQELADKSRQVFSGLDEKSSALMSSAVSYAFGFEEEELKSFSPEERQNIINNALRELFKHRSSKSPLFLAFEDLHNYSEISEFEKRIKDEEKKEPKDRKTKEQLGPDLVSFLTNALDQENVFFWFDFRPGFSSALTEKIHALELRKMNSEEVEQLIADSLGTKIIPKGLVQFLSRVEGNPLFLKETL
ncbi:MAG: adenylate/guanylate cyclase domain-containing protein, partial [Candidatus Diapherotrites archaeon]|nr:adenylate/guanylate cyclase domain-containing protein [Candidatus Diapherotrites archaeon]